MSLSKNFILGILGVIILVLGIFVVSKFLINRNQASANLKILSVPQATIFLESQHLGKTPYEDKTKAGEYTLKLIPESGASNLSSWETKIKLTSGVLTYINHEFGDQEVTSAGEILTLEKISSKNSEIAVLSTPDGAKVTLDGLDRGITPLVLSEIEPGDHEISLTTSDYLDRAIKVKTSPGFKLIASFQLAMSTIPSPSATPSASPVASTSPKPTPKTSPKSSASPSSSLKKPYVKILETPTGWLRVRVEPDKNATEAAKVNPGETYSLLGEQSGWYKIKYQETSEGWISGQYAEKYE